MKRCPRCLSELHETQIGAVRVDGCNGCGGVWFDNNELGAVANAHATNLLALEDHFLPNSSASVRVERMQCPGCQAAMYTFEFPHSPGIPLDACPQCKGIWVDNGELQAIYRRMTGASPAPAPTAPDLRHNARQAAAILASHPCPHCKQMNPSVSLACWACGEKLPARNGPLCPNCDVGMHGKTLFGVALDVCPACTGVWLNAGELSTLAERPPSELQQVIRDERPDHEGVSAFWEKEPRMLCPACCVVMEEQEDTYRSGVRLVRCARCNGLWVGAGKLLQISQHYHRGLGIRNPIGEVSG